MDEEFMQRAIKAAQAAGVPSSPAATAAAIAAAAAVADRAPRQQQQSSNPAATQGDKSTTVPYRDFFRSPAVWAVTVAHFCFNWGYYTLLAWLPSYFEMALGLNVQESSFLTLIPYVAMIAMTPVVSNTDTCMIGISGGCLRVYSEILGTNVETCGRLHLLFGYIKDLWGCYTVILYCSTLYCWGHKCWVWLLIVRVQNSVYISNVRWILNPNNRRSHPTPNTQASSCRFEGKFVTKSTQAAFTSTPNTNPDECLAASQSSCIVASNLLVRRCGSELLSIGCSKWYELCATAFQIGATAF